MAFENYEFDMEENVATIKVIGVGGAGGNAVNRMIETKTQGVDFIAANTDAMALRKNNAPKKILLGEKITHGRGAGANPEVGKSAADETLEDIRAELTGADMLFITAGMGGGTGTGAAPVIAQVSKEMGILTVGIITIPFRFEGNRKIDQALDGVEEMSKHVDALLVINNERLRSIYPDLSFMAAFGKADDTLSIAAKSIAEIITVHGIINLDFKDVKTVLQDGGVAIMSTGYGEGEDRVKKAIEDALNSPLLNDNDIFNSKKILLNISFTHQKDSKDNFMMEEMNYVNEFMEKFGSDFVFKWGVAVDPELGKRVKVTILATGFGMQNVDGMEERIAKQQTREEANRLAEEQEKAAKRDERRGHYYGDNDTAKRYKRRPNIYIFVAEDLDNDDVISNVEQTPTYKRTKDILASIGSDSVAPEPQHQEQPEPVQGVISFV